MIRIAETIGVARSNLVRRTKPPAPAQAPVGYSQREDEDLLARIRFVVDQRGSYGYRRVAALLNRAADVPRVNHKRVYRVMRAADLLLQRHTGKSTRTHDGKIITLKSNMRWCSDSFEIRCWDGQRLQVAFALDCCDREVMSWVATTAAITGEMVRDLMAESIEARFWRSGAANASPSAVAERQRPAVHRQRDARVRRGSGPRRLHHAGLLTRVERYGRGLREDLQTRLRISKPARHGRRGHASTCQLVRRLQLPSPTQGSQHAVPSSLPPSNRNLLTMSDLAGATPHGVRAIVIATRSVT
jgi:hypothetical protein